ncbi:MAG: DMT family transporter [Chloroflexota bacterium]|nr:DMT family transporter [Chloroflexota bacterium]
MLGYIGAALAALGWGTDAVLARQGLRRLHPAVGTFLSLCASLTVCALLLLIVDPGGLGRYPLGGVAWFALIGLINFLIGRQCNFGATKRLGAARSASIFATSPLVSILLATLFTGERASAPLLFGAGLIVAGVILVVTS